MATKYYQNLGYELIGFSIYFTDECSSSGLTCIPLQQCPQVNQIALNIQELDSHENNAIKKLELLNEINNRLCGGRIKKELHVCCENIVEIEKLEEIPSSVSDNSDKGFTFPLGFNDTFYVSLFLRLPFH